MKDKGVKTSSLWRHIGRRGVGITQVKKPMLHVNDCKGASRRESEILLVLFKFFTEFFLVFRAVIDRAFASLVHFKRYN